jgi:shikimate kinase
VTEKAAKQMAPERLDDTSPCHHVTLSPGHLVIFLIGYRGSGKTTVAQMLATQLGWEWVDADALLEKREGRTIQQIFASEGETAFREKEAALLSELAERLRCVVATGGGVVLREDNRSRMRSSGRCVWLTADANTLWQRLAADTSTAQRRPNLTMGGLAEIEDLLKQREPLYRACADLTVDTTGRKPEEITRAILSWWTELS